MPGNFFHYLPETAREEPWGCTVVSVGRFRVEPGSPYPPQRHPDDYHFTWERGRILQSFALVWLSRGGGTFESYSTTGTRKVGPGDVLLLFPGEWHRYTPDLGTGWTEHWVVARGAAFERARELGQLTPEKPVATVADTSAWAQVFDLIAHWTQRGALEHQTVLSTLGTHLLALLLETGGGTPGGEADNMVRRARQLLTEGCAEALDMEEVAARLGMGYSLFRKRFREETGVSPKRFQQEARLQKAREYLANTSMPLKEMAERLGFHSAFHFSRQFKDLAGESPSEWRKRQGRKT